MPEKSLLYPVVGTTTGTIDSFNLIKGGVKVGNVVTGGASKVQTVAKVANKVLKPTTAVLGGLAAEGSTVAKLAKVSPVAGGVGAVIEGADVLRDRDAAINETLKDIEGKGVIQRGVYGLTHPMHAINAATAEVGKAISASSELAKANETARKLKEQGIPLVGEDGPDMDL